MRHQTIANYNGTMYGNKVPKIEKNTIDYIGDSLDLINGYTPIDDKDINALTCSKTININYIILLSLMGAGLVLWGRVIERLLRSVVNNGKDLSTAQLFCFGLSYMLIFKAITVIFDVQLYV